MYRFLSILPLLFFLYSCSTLPLENTDMGTPSSPEIVIQKIAVYQGINEFSELLNHYNNSYISDERDIDNRDWIIKQINFWADRDQLAVQRIYEDLQYRNWTDEEKSEYLNSTIPLLLEDRESMLEDLAYLIDRSNLFQDMPWMVRDYYDERSEFSFWYLVYMGRTMYPFWLDESVLPAMLMLIPEDRLTAVTYLWMKNPENLSSMKLEIYNAGYPWSRLLYLLEMAETVNTEIERLLPPGEIKSDIQAGNLI
jgi:hypothetical protein